MLSMYCADSPAVALLFHRTSFGTYRGRRHLASQSHRRANRLLIVTFARVNYARSAQSHRGSLQGTKPH
jgi:hypothetical protein